MFEDHLKILEEKADAIRREDVTLDEALKAYEEGMKAYEECKKTLLETKGKIEVYDGKTI